MDENVKDKNSENSGQGVLEQDELNEDGLYEFDDVAGEQFSSDFREFMESVSKRFCPWCGSPVGYKGRGRPRVFCSDRCRWAANKQRERDRKKMGRIPDRQEGERCEYFPEDVPEESE